MSKTAQFSGFLIYEARGEPTLWFGEAIILPTNWEKKG